MDDKKLAIHQQLMTDISEAVDPTSTEYDSWIQHMTTFVPRGILSRNKTLLGKLQAMATKGKLAPGKYEELKSVADKSGNIDILEMIKTAEKKIRALEVARAGPGSISHTSGAKRQRQEDTTENLCDVLYTRNDGLGYYDSQGKTGYLLILNSTHNRNGTEQDVRKLNEFFQETLKFDVDNPREIEEHDLSTSQLDDALEEARNKLNDATSSKKYYCFVCAILSHGDEDGITTTDGSKSVEAIRKEFNNKAIRNFAGKPKVFFVQACRGIVAQDSVDCDDEADDIRDVPPDDPPDDSPDDDESDTIIRIPTDADTMIAFSTTPGYLSYRKPTTGSWFINTCLDVFKEFKGSHLEDMMITVRDRVVAMQTRKGEKQMPCIWSSMTKRLVWTSGQ